MIINFYGDKHVSWLLGVLNKSGYPYVVRSCVYWVDDNDNFLKFRQKNNTDNKTKETTRHEGRKNEEPRMPGGDGEDQGIQRMAMLIGH